MNDDSQVFVWITINLMSVFFERNFRKVLDSYDTPDKKTKRPISLLKKQQKPVDMRDMM